MNSTTGQNIHADFSDALYSEGPSSEMGSASGVYDWLIGSWSVRVVDIEKDGSRRESQGEWHFTWALEGRAIQDIFIVPSRNQRSTGMPKEYNRYGATLRIYDPELKAWRITWTNPVRCVQNQLIARKVGNDIVQEGRNEKGMLFMRWSFRDIEPNSFRWVGEESSDDGKTWHAGAEFFATRNSTGKP